MFDPAATAVFLADPADAAVDATLAVVPFRCLLHVSCPPTAVIAIESVEPWATCPDGWHESPVFVASQGGRA